MTDIFEAINLLEEKFTSIFSQIGPEAMAEYYGVCMTYMNFGLRPRILDSWRV